MGGYDPNEGRPKLAAWYNRVKQETKPHYDDVSKVIDLVIKKFGGNSPTDISKL